MASDPHHRQIAREARWALGMTFFYVIAWCACAYLPGNSQGVLGFPLWFELSCLYLSILFILMTYLVVKRIFVEIPFEEDKK